MHLSLGHLSTPTTLHSLNRDMLLSLFILTLYHTLIQKHNFQWPLVLSVNVFSTLKILCVFSSAYIFIHSADIIYRLSHIAGAYIRKHLTWITKYHFM